PPSPPTARGKPARDFGGSYIRATPGFRFPQNHHLQCRAVSPAVSLHKASRVNRINPASDAHQIFLEALLGRPGAFHRSESFWGAFNLGHGMRLPTSLPS
ncbi:hypothetical protein, partial [Salipiger bermudensis]|uniref:hypothetical protein n=1 Tax=Salipiger bermudensis TaxID=344736 RepID=UPI00300B2A1A